MSAANEAETRIDQMLEHFAPRPGLCEVRGAAAPDGDHPGHW